LLLALALAAFGVLFLPGWVPGLRSTVVGTEAVPVQSAKARLLAPLESDPDESRARTSLASGGSTPESPELAREGTATIEVKLLWRGEALVGASVDLFRLAEEDYGFLFGEQESPVAARARTDGEGLARFDREPPGRRGVLATGPDGSEGRVLLLVGANPEEKRIVISLGTAGLEGTVYAPGGGSAVGCRVLVRQDSISRDGQVWFLGKADGAGNYRIGGLAGGPAHAVTAALLDLRLPEATPLTLGSDEWRRLDFGSPGGEARWSGVLRLKSGRIIAGPGRLYFVGRANSAVQTGFFDSEGRFDARLPSGTYEARLGDPSGLTVGDAELSGVHHQDLVFPGIALLGRVSYVGTKHPRAKGPESEVVVTLERKDGGSARPASVRTESRYGFFGLEPGTYVMTASPWIAEESSDGRVEIEIGAGVEEVVHDLEITDP